MELELRAYPFLCRNTMQFKESILHKMDKKCIIAALNSRLLESK
jgi:hypothetical protein